MFYLAVCEVGCAARIEKKVARRVVPKGFVRVLGKLARRLRKILIALQAQSAYTHMWRRVVTAMHQEIYSDVELRYLFVDNAAMQMILAPNQFDVMLTSNLFGDIIS